MSVFANSASQATDFATQAVAWLQQRLPRGWSVELGELPTEHDQPQADARINLRGPHGATGAIVVEEMQSVPPRTVLSSLRPRVKAARSMGAHLPLLVITPWLSERSQLLLAEAEINYLDLTGNARLHIDNPPFFLQTTGARRNPQPAQRPGAKLRGVKTFRLIRLLLDVHPPYGVVEIAEATGLNRGYVSRLLETLYREGLIERRSRGPVESVDVPALLHRWAQSYDPFRTNLAEGFVAAAGLDQVLAQLAEESDLAEKVSITGSFAANRLEPVTSPALLLLYHDSPRVLAAKLNLLPSDEGANVMILKPFDAVVYERTQADGNLRYAAPSQVAADCLAGNGRMPAEGEAVLEWMAADESAWRLTSLAGLEKPTAAGTRQVATPTSLL